jgi:hypothetical protein
VSVGLVLEGGDAVGCGVGAGFCAAVGFEDADTVCESGAAVGFEGAATVCESGAGVGFESGAGVGFESGAGVGFAGGAGIGFAGGAANASRGLGGFCAGMP